MLKNLFTLLKYKDLLWMWSKREISVRYKQSFLGIAWAIVQPLSLMLVFSLVFTYFVKIPSDNLPYPIFSYTALLPWTFFSTSITFASSCLVNNMNLVTKVYFPREILPVASIIASFVDFLVASLIFVGLLFYYQISVNWNILWILIILLIQIILTAGVALATSAVNVLYRDVRFIVPLGLQILMYATPVIYPLSVIPKQLHGIYMLNPLAGIINAYRQVILEGQIPDFNYLLVAAVVSLFIFIGGYALFKYIEPTIADVI